MLVRRPSAVCFTSVVFLITAVQCSLQVCDEPEYHGGNYGNHFGSFSSPDYPSAYPINTKCVWMIKVPIGYRIRLQFNAFQVESCSQGATTCACDVVDVFDGQLSVSKRLGRFCGQALPNTTYTSGRFMRVELISDSGGVDRKGFSASYVSIAPDGTPYSLNEQATARPSPKGGPGSKSGSTVMIATICVVAVVVFIGLIILLIIRKRANEESRQRTISAENAQPDMSRDNRPPAPPLSRPAVPKPHVTPASDAPPPYSEAIHAPTSTPPPPYNSEY